jgi:tetratricopeptide (TPR) repeat protein
VRALWLLRRYRSARYALRRLLVEFPRWPDVHVIRGEIALGQRDDPVFLGITNGSSHRDTKEACDAFGEALRLNPASVPAWRGQAAAARMDGDFDTALGVLDKAELEVGLQPSLYLERAFCARDEGRLMEALHQARVATRHTPRSVEARLVEAGLLLEAFRPEDAVRSLDWLRDADLRSAAYHVIAGAVLDMQMWRTADLSLRQCLRERSEAHMIQALRDPSCGPTAVWAVIGKLASRDQRVLLERALQGDPDSPALRTRLASVLDDLGESARAVDMAQLAVAVDPMYLTARRIATLALLAHGNPREAETLARTMIEDHPRHADVHYVAAQVDFKARRLESTLAHALTARELTPNRPWAQRNAANARRLLGDIAGAEEEVRAAIKQWPGYVWLRYQYARCALDEGRRHDERVRLKDAAVIGSKPTRLAIRMPRRNSGKSQSAASRGLAEIRTWMMRHPIYWLFGRRSDTQAIKRLDEAIADRKWARDLLPEDSRTRIQGLLRALDWDAARSYVRVRHLTQVILMLVGIAVAGLLLAAPRRIALVVGITPPQIAAPLYYLAAFSFISASYLTTKTRLRTDATSASVLAVLLTAYLATAHGHLQSPLAFGLVVSVVLPIFLLEVVNLLRFGSIWLMRGAERRAKHRHPVAALISALLKLYVLFDSERMTNVRTRSRCLQLVEEVAQAQERALREPLSQGIESTEPELVERTMNWAAETATAARRRLKEKILAPDANAHAVLRSRVEDTLHIACQGRWKDLPTATPPAKRIRSRAWLSVAASTLLVAALPPAALLVYQFVLRPLSPHDLPEPYTWLQIGLYIIWPPASLLWRLDPDFSAKMNLLRGLQPGGTGKSAERDATQGFSG